MRAGDKGKRGIASWQCRQCTKKPRADAPVTSTVPLHKAVPDTNWRTIAVSRPASLPVKEVIVIDDDDDDVIILDQDPRESNGSASLARQAEPTSGSKSPVPATTSRQSEEPSFLLRTDSVARDNGRQGGAKQQSTTWFDQV